MKIFALLIAGALLSWFAPAAAQDTGPSSRVVSQVAARFSGAHIQAVNRAWAAILAKYASGVGPITRYSVQIAEQGSRMTIVFRPASPVPASAPTIYVNLENGEVIDIFEPWIIDDSGLFQGNRGDRRGD
jgi:hypothetical protein